MGQVRNLLRGVAYTLEGSPAGVLTRLDGAMRGLQVEPFVTAALVQLAADDRGVRTLRWSNAGHPPPILLAPDGRASLLRGERADPLLGVGFRDRADHEIAVEPGSAVVLYTDGLVERRGIPLDRSLRWLTDALEGRHDLDAEQLADHVVGLLGTAVEDDVALLVLRID
jgi:serine phosphatase RsbU (regulator of sigma subunit)